MIDYVINGTKTWITNGVYGSCFGVLVKTDPEAQPRHRGMSLFVCEKGEGFTVGRKLRKLGYRSIDSAELVFDNHRVPAARLVRLSDGAQWEVTPPEGQSWRLYYYPAAEHVWMTTGRDPGAVTITDVTRLTIAELEPVP